MSGIHKPENRKRRWLRRILLALLIIAAAPLLASSWLFEWLKKSPAPSPDRYVFRDGFENAKALEDIMALDWSRWHGVQTQGGGKVEVSAEKVHSGSVALKCYATARSGELPKADIERSKLQLVKGDHVYFRDWYYLSGPGSNDDSTIFLWDLEDTSKRGSPGRRLYIQGNGRLASDLGKWWTGRTIRQPKESARAFPRDRWVCVRVHLLLSHKSSDGILEVWQDDTKVLDARCQTLPTGATAYNRFQIGITAHDSREHAVTLYVDDVEFSNRPLW